MNKTVTNYVWYNQFSVALILHSIKVYFFTCSSCSYFRILYSLLHLKDSSTSIGVKIRWSTLNLHSIGITTPNDYTFPRLLYKVQFSDHVTSFPSTMTQYFLTKTLSGRWRELKNKRRVLFGNALWHVGKRSICKQSPYRTKFTLTIFITFTSP